MTFSRVNSIGWALYERLTSAQMNALDVNVSRSLDGYAGGVYSPSVGLVVNGAAAATGYALETRPTSVRAGLRAVQNASFQGLVVHALASVAQAALPAEAARFDGTVNTAGHGGYALILNGGAGGPSGIGGAAAVLTGGNGTTGQAGGVGVIAFGGTRYAAGSTPHYWGAGAYHLGGDSAAVGLPGGPGTYAKGGASASGLGGPGGLFDGGAGRASGYHGEGLVARGYGAPSGWTSERAAGLAAHGGSDNFAGYGGMGVWAQGGYGAVGGYGFYAKGGTGATVAAGGGGVYAEGAGVAVAYKGIPGPSGMLAANFEGGVDFDSGSAIRKNPPAGQFMSNKLYAKSIVKAWGLIRDGVLVDGFNVASVTEDPSDSYRLAVAFSAPMESADYAVICSGSAGWGSNNPRAYVVNRSSAISGNPPSTTGFELLQYAMASGGTASWSSESECHFVVFGAQS